MLDGWILLLCVTVIFTCIICAITKAYTDRKSKNIVGTLRVIYEEGEDQPYMFLELSQSPDILKELKEVTLTVTHEKPTL